MTAVPENTIAVVDLGKTHSRVAVYTCAGERLAGFGIDSAQLASPEGALDVDTLASWCEDVLADLYWEQPFTRLVPVTHGATAAALQGDHLAVPVTDYEAPVDPALNAAYESLRPDFSETGSPSLPLGLNLGRQLYALQQTQPAFELADTLLTYPQYWTWRWCGARGTDVSSLGCHTDLWQPQKADWSSLAHLQGWPNKFPPLIDAGRRAAPARSTLLPAAAQKGPVDVHWGIHDSNAALAAFLGAAEPFTLLSSGTWLVAFAVGVAPTLDAARDTLWNVDVRGRPVASARCMLGREYASIGGRATVPVNRTDLVQLLRTDALALPAFAPAGPFADRPGCVIGQPLQTDRERSALASLYVALMTDVVLNIVGARGDIIVEGPLAMDDAALAALASLRDGQAVRGVEVSSCVAYGAVRLACAEGSIPPPPTRTVAADPALTGPLQAVKRRWQQLISGNFS